MIAERLEPLPRPNQITLGGCPSRKLLSWKSASLREVLVEEQPHAGGTETNKRSRSAAKARQARMSSRVKSGKSRRISPSLIPDARYSRTSVTVIRRPRMQGFPPRLPGSTVIRERQSMAQDYGQRAGQVNLFRPATLAAAPAPAPQLAPRGRRSGEERGFADPRLADSRSINADWTGDRRFVAYPGKKAPRVRVVTKIASSALRGPGPRSEE